MTSRVGGGGAVRRQRLPLHCPPAAGPGGAPSLRRRWGFGGVIGGAFPGGICQFASSWSATTAAAIDALQPRPRHHSFFCPLVHTCRDCTYSYGIYDEDMVSPIVQVGKETGRQASVYDGLPPVEPAFRQQGTPAIASTSYRQWAAANVNSRCRPAVSAQFGYTIGGIFPRLTVLVVKVGVCGCRRL